MLFQSEIARIVWEYKLAPETINLATKMWPEVEVFRIELKHHELPLKILKTIDSNIPYPILFIITKGSAEKAIIGYKEQNRNNANATKVDTYFETGWNDDKLNDIKINGLDVDTVYSNFIRQIAGDRLAAHDNIASMSANGNIDSGSIKTDLNRMKEREQIQKQIAALDRRIRAEPSIGKKQKLAEEKYKLLQRL